MLSIDRFSHRLHNIDPEGQALGHQVQNHSFKSFFIDLIEIQYIAKHISKETLLKEFLTYGEKHLCLL